MTEITLHNCPYDSKRRCSNKPSDGKCDDCEVKQEADRHYSSKKERAS